MNITYEHRRIILIMVWIIWQISDYAFRGKKINKYSTSSAITSILCLLLYMNTVINIIFIPFQWPLIFTLMILWLILDILYSKSVRPKKKISADEQDAFNDKTNDDTNSHLDR